MNLLFLAECNWFDWVVFDLHFMAEGLAARGHKVYALEHRWQAHNTRVYPFYEQIEVPEIAVYRDDGKVRVRRPGWINGPGPIRYGSVIWSHTYAVARAIKEWKIDAVIIYSSLFNGWQGVLWSRLLNIPAIVRIVDKHHILPQSRMVRAATLVAEKIMYRWCDYIMALTPDYGRYVVNMWAKDSKVELLLFPIDTQLFQPRPGNRQLQNQLGIKDNDRVLVFMGSLFYFTGVDRLVATLPQVLKEVPNTKLIIVGDGAARQKVEESIKDSGMQDHVIITGYQPFRTMPDYINLADVCVNAFPINDKTKEIMSSKINQYFACGKPVVSTALPGITSMLSESNGILYAENCDEMVSQIVRLLKDDKLCREMGEAGLEYARAVNDYESIITQFESVIKEQINKKSAKRRAG